jgi:hypothetical protein
MYMQESQQPVGEYHDHGEGAEYGFSPGLSMAVAVPIGVGIAIGEVLEVIAIVLAAIAAAYLLIQAYEAAKARGFGVALAQRLLSAGLGRLLSGARRLVDVIRRLLERARRVLNGGRGDCAAAIAALVAALAELEATIAQLTAESQSPVPRIAELRRLMEQLRRQASAIRGPIENVIRACAA